MKFGELDEYRSILGEIADVILPQWKHMPAATSIDIANEPIDAVLRLRSDLLSNLVQVLSLIKEDDIESSLEHLQDNSPHLVLALMTTITGAYYMNKTVQEALGYSGQQAQSLPRDGFGAEELVVEMMDMPPRYR